MTAKKDLVALVADLDIEQTLKGLLSRDKSLGIRPISYDIFRHQNRDAGCWKDEHDFLKIFINKYRYALVIFDHEGCGQEKRDISELRADLNQRLINSGWAEGHTEAIIFQPELEIWVWSDSPKVDECLGWANRTPDLRSWLRANNWFNKDAVKPEKPKEALQAALRSVNKRFSASIFEALAKQVSLDRCTDESFQLFRTTLERWFPISE
jgi:hypothetical protein